MEDLGPARCVRDLGMKQDAEIGFESCWNPATGALALEAVTRNAGGGCSMRSPWLAHTVMHASGSKPANRPTASRTVTSARPYSRWREGFTSPPARCATSCIP